MRKTFNHKKIIIIIAIFVLVAIFIGGIFAFLKYRSKKDALELENNFAASYEMLLHIAEMDAKSFDDDLIADYLNNNQEEIERVKLAYPAYYYFAQGMINVHQKNNSLAINNLTMSLQILNLPYFEEFSGSSAMLNEGYEKYAHLSPFAECIAARAYYELARLLDGYGFVENGREYRHLIPSVLSPDTNSDYLIILGCWASYDASEVEGGADEAVVIMESVVDVAEKYGFDNMVAVYSALAEAYYSKGDVVNFVVTELKALDKAKKNNDVVNTIIIETAIGIQYINQYCYDKAWQYLEEAYSLTVEDDEEYDNLLKSYVCSNIVSLCIQQKDYVKAKEYLEEMEYYSGLVEGVLGEDDYANLLASKALYEINAGDPNIAIQYLDEAKQIYDNSISFNYTNFDLELYILYGDAYVGIGDGGTALAYYEQAEKLCVRRGYESENRYILGYCKAYCLMSDLENAFKYGILYKEELETLISDAENNQAALYIEEFESKEKDNDIAALKSKNTWYIRVIALTILFIILCVFGIYGNVKANRRIAALNENLRNLSEHDGLTGLYNRRKLDEYLEEKWETIMMLNKPTAVIMMDVDFFKLYNDFYGHQKGDNALISVADVLKTFSNSKIGGPADIIAARYGGEEFVMVIPNRSYAEAETIIMNIQNSVRKLEIPHEKSTVSDYVTVSIGCALIDKSEKKFEALNNYEHAITLADKALYEAKKTRNTYCFYE